MARYEIEESSLSLGTVVLGTELILTSPILHSFLRNTFNLPTVVCLIIDLVAIIEIPAFCATNKILRFIVALIYSTVWIFIVGSITNNVTDSNKIWMVINSIIAFLVSFYIHMSLGWWSEYDRYFIIRKK